MPLDIGGAVGVLPWLVQSPDVIRPRHQTDEGFFIRGYDDSEVLEVSLIMYLAAGPDFNHLDTYDTGASGASWDIVLDGSDYWFKCSGINQGALTLRPQGAIPAPIPSFIWFIGRWKYDTEDFTDGQTTPHEIVRWQMVAGGHVHQLTPLGLANGKCKVRLRKNDGTNVGDSLTEYSADTILNIRVQLDGARVTVWINGIIEMDVAETEYPTNTQMVMSRAGSPGPGGEWRWRGWGTFGSNDVANRPDPATLEEQRIDPDGETSENDGEPLPAADHNLNVDDYAGYSQPDNDTTVLNMKNFDDDDVSTMTTVTVSGDLIVGVVHRLWARALSLGKVGNSDSRLKYNGMLAPLVPLDNYSAETYSERTAVHSRPPGGGIWSQTIIDGIEAGLHSYEINTTFIYFSAFSLGVFSVSLDPPRLHTWERFPEPVIPRLAVVASGMTVGGEVE